MFEKDPERASLRWKLFPHQKKIYDAVYSALKDGRRRFCLNCSRRLGKTFTMMLIAVETALRKRKGRILVAAPSKEHLIEFVFPIMEEILADMPEDMRPKKNEAKGLFIFPTTGARIVMRGCDTRAKANRLRGPSCDLAIIEEAGSIPDLNYVRRSVIGPQLLSTKGVMLYASTPPDTVGHEFVEIAESMRQRGTYVHMTVWEGHYTKEEILEFIREDADGMPVEEYMETEDYRREYMAEFITDPARAVFKYATDAHLSTTPDRLGTVIARYLKLQRPAYRVGYAGGDWGWAPDWTGVLWGYWHFRERTLVIERELILKRMRTNEFAEKSKEIERELFGPDFRTPFRDGSMEIRRWSDHDQRLLADVAVDHGIIWNPTPKDDKDSAIDALDRMIPGFNGHLAINPEGCPELIQQLKACLWNKNRTSFARTKRHGHFDLVDGLIYLARNVVRDEDPFPADFGLDPRHLFLPDGMPVVVSGLAAKWAKVVGLDPREDLEQ